MSTRTFGYVIGFAFGAASLLITSQGFSEGPTHGSKEKVWEKISEEEGVTVWQSEAEEGGVISLRGAATLDYNSKVVFMAISEAENAVKWMPLVAERRTLHQINDRERVEYTHLDMPWPLSDRYFVNSGHADFRKNGEIHVSTKSQVPPSFIDEDKVLGHLHKSEFIFTPKAGDTKTHLWFEINSDPKGMVPKFLVNMAQRKWPRDFFAGLRGFLKDNHVRLQRLVDENAAKLMSH